MPTSLFSPYGVAYMDAVTPTSPGTNNFNVGLYYLGSSKTYLRRSILAYDLAIPASGPPILPGTVILDAHVDMYCYAVFETGGDGGHQVDVARVTRADWDPVTATWNNYKSGSAWTVAGGDISTPSVTNAYSSPLAAGNITIPGLVAMVEDARDNRSGRLIMHVRLNSEADDDHDRIHLASPEGSYPTPMYLTVTTPEIASIPADDTHTGASILDTHAGARAARPAAAASGAAPARPAGSTTDGR